MANSGIPTWRSRAWKLRAKRLLGIADETDAANAVRCRYNDLLRKRYADEPVYDLALVEATRLDGTHETFGYKGQTCYSLAHEYTEDGGHLNRQGREAAAAQLVIALAKALAERGGT